MAGVGTLQNIQQEATELLHVVSSCPVGAQRAVYDFKGGQSYSKLLAIKRKEKELLSKCVEVEAEINRSKGDKHTFDAVEDRSERIQQLKMEIADVKAKHYQDDLLLDLLKKSQLASKIIFSQKNLEMDTSKRLLQYSVALCTFLSCIVLSLFAYKMYWYSDLKSGLQQESEVVAELLRNFKEVESTRKEIDTIRTQRSAVQMECRKLMSHLQQENEQRSPGRDTTQTIEEMKDKLKEVTSRTVLLQHTLQALIGGCTNWAEDEELQEFLLS